MRRVLTIAMGLLVSAPCFAQLPLGLRGADAGAVASAFRRHDTAIQGNGCFGFWGEGRLAPNASILWEVNYTAMGGLLKDKAMYTNEGIYSCDFHLRWAFIEVPVMLAFYLPLGRGVKATFFSGPSLLFYRKDLSITEKGPFLEPWEPGTESEYIWASEPWAGPRHRRRLGYHVGLGIRNKTVLISVDYFQLDDDVADLVTSIYRVQRRVHGLRLVIRCDLVNWLGKGNRP